MAKGQDEVQFDAESDAESPSRPSFPEEPAPPVSRSALPRILIALGLVVGALAYRGLLVWEPDPVGSVDLTRFFFRWNASPRVVLALGALLLYARRRQLREAVGGGGEPLLALPLLSVGTALFLWGVHANAIDLQLASLMALLLGVSLLLFGRKFARTLAPPVLFLAFAIPPPAALINQILFPLQTLSTQHAAWLLQPFGDYLSTTTVITGGGGRFEVIEACSGLRSIQVLTMIAVAWLCLSRARPLHVALMIAMAPLIAYLANLGRIVTLVLHPQSELNEMHALQGAAIFFVGAFALAAMEVALAARIPRDGERSMEARGPARGRFGRRGATAALGGLLCGLLAASLWLPRWEGPTARPRFELPTEIAGFHQEGDPLVRPQFLAIVTWATRWHISRRYRRDGETVELFLGYDDWLRRDRSMLSPKLALLGGGWWVEERSRLALEPDGEIGHVVVARSFAARVVSHHWYEGAFSWPIEAARAALAVDQSFLRDRDGAWVVRLSTRTYGTPEDRERAETRLRDFGRSLRLWIAEQERAGEHPLDPLHVP